MKGSPNNVIHNLAVHVINGFKDLQPNWDTYGALPVEFLTRELALHLLVQVLLPREIYMNIVPTNNGGIGFEGTGDDDSYIGIMPHGSIFVSLDGDHYTDTWVNSLDELATYLDERLK